MGSSASSITDPFTGIGKPLSAAAWAAHNGTLAGLVSPPLIARLDAPGFDSASSFAPAMNAGRGRPRNDGGRHKASRERRLAFLSSYVSMPQSESTVGGLADLLFWRDGRKRHWPCFYNIQDRKRAATGPGCLLNISQ
ncbi:hypothetical protein MRX96_058305 [Rhipicephalus microplus]